jgi:PAS domain S-box-containing protein
MKEQALAYFGAVIPLKDILTPEQVVFALALPQAAAREHLWQILTSLMLTGLICFVIASLFLRFFARKISKPIQQAAQFAGCIAKGNLSKRLLLNSQDEAGRLAHEMNCMADSLAQKEQLSIALNETQSRLVETERDRADALQHAKEAAEASARFAERQRKLMSSLASSRSTDELFDKLMQHLCDAWGFNALHFQMVDHENTMLRHSFFRSTLSIDPSLIQKTLYDIPFDSRESVAATVAMRRKRFFVDQRRTRQLEKMTPFDRTIIQNLQISETLIIPIIIHNVCLGVLHLHAIRKHLELNLAAINDINLFVGNLASQIMLVRRTIELNASQTYLKTVLDTCPDAIFVHDARTGQIIDVNRSMCEIYGYHREETLTLNIEQLSEGSPPYDQSHALILMEKSLKNGPQSFEWLAKRKDGSLFWAIISLRSATIAERELIVVLVHDISSIKEAEESNMALQQQLFEARKTESIGRLAGGVAHDFNNLLGVIIGYAELGMVQVEDAHPFKPKLKQILEVAERSADLTRQLLAFARRQTIAPVSLDLNLCIETMLEMVKRLIGENITLSWKPADNLPPVKMDRSQLDQLVTNLCVNARDAIADSGTLSIETGEKEVDPVFCHSYPDCAPGKYVYFTVRDTGSGIDKAVLENIFEPFFTTKPAGKGTGLGLATIQGIVHQNNGFIQVDSHLGKGSSFTIYLPALDETLDKSLDKTLDETAQSRGGTPNSAPPDMDFPQIHSPNGLTVLVVEDEPSLMEMVLQILNVLGHKAYSTNNPDEALTLAKTHASEISILLTDVIMPSMNGKALSEEIRTFIPGIKTLFMSGYTADVIAEQGVLQKGISFIQKPFTIKSLEAAIQSLTRS